MNDKNSTEKLSMIKQQDRPEYKCSPDSKELKNMGTIDAPVCGFSGEICCHKNNEERFYIKLVNKSDVVILPKFIKSVSDAREFIDALENTAEDMRAAIFSEIAVDILKSIFDIKQSCRLQSNKD